MQNVQSRLEQVIRPRLMVRAARFGVQEYRRERDLRRVLKTTSLPGASRALIALFSEEQRLEEARLTGDSNYDLVRHVDVLIALMSEARDYLAAHPRVRLVSV